MKFPNENLADLDKVIEYIKNNYQYRGILLYGPLGCGKTTLVSRWLMDACVTSPTFNLCNYYDAYKTWHFDLYLWKEEQDIGLQEAIFSDNMLFIEHPKFPIHNTIEIHFLNGEIILQVNQ